MENIINNHWLLQSDQYNKSIKNLDKTIHSEFIIFQQEELKKIRKEFINKANDTIRMEKPFSWHESFTLDDGDKFVKDVMFYKKLIYYSIYAGNTYLTYKWGIEYAKEKNVNVDFESIKNLIYDKWLKSPSKIDLKEIHIPYIEYLYDNII